jgi:hypothetical protein
MSDLPADLDLKFLPDWLKEGGAANRYADYEGERGGERAPREDRGRDERSPRGPRRPDRRDARRPQRDGPPARPQGRAPQRGEDKRHRGGPPRGGGGLPQPARASLSPARPPVDPGVRVEFLPEPNALAMIARQIKASGRAYPLFGTARLFLERPERHRVRFTSVDPNRALFQLDDGPVGFDRASVERNAFQHFRNDFYHQEVTVGEPLKGNFTNVARCRSTGALLGPTNYHAYQPALRKLYEERFSRRMSFPQFQAEEIVVLTDEQTITAWKEQARATTTYVTLKEEERLTFKTAAEAEQHFRRTYLPSLVKSGVVLECSGQASRAIADRGLANLLRTTWEKERAFPASVVNHVRAHLLEAGLHFFKHRKRILFVSPIRPQRHQSGHVFSEGIAAILGIIEATPRITRPQLASKVLGDDATQPDVAAKKAALAADLHYLIHAGHVIEFHDGTLDLPLSPRAEKEAVAAGAGEGDVSLPASPPVEQSAQAVGLAAEVAILPNETSLSADVSSAEAGDVAAMIPAPVPVVAEAPLVTTNPPVAVRDEAPLTGEDEPETPGGTAGVE